MIKKTVIVIGGAGFIGSNLIKVLTFDRNIKVVCIDNYVNSTKDNIKNFFKMNFEFYNVDMSKKGAVDSLIKNVFTKHEVDDIWHLAANSDIQSGVLDLSIDYRNTFLTTKYLLNSLEKYNVKFNNFIFASSSAVYGYHKNVKLSEVTGPLLPISNYGAMKLASEALISSFQERNKSSKCYIFRFPNVVGIPATHGVILDFFTKIYKTNKLDVLGNGSQLKQYLHVCDLVNAMLYVKDCSIEDINLFNIGNIDSGVTVKEIAEIVTKFFNKTVSIHYGGSDRGWIGDVPRFEFSIDKLRKIGWTPKYSSLDAIKIAANEIYCSDVWRK